MNGRNHPHEVMLKQSWSILNAIKWCNDFTLVRPLLDQFLVVSCRAWGFWLDLYLFLYSSSCFFTFFLYCFMWKAPKATRTPTGKSSRSPGVVSQQSPTSHWDSIIKFLDSLMTRLRENHVSFSSSFAVITGLLHSDIDLFRSSLYSQNHLANMPPFKFSTKKKKKASLLLWRFGVMWHFGFCR